MPWERITRIRRDVPLVHNITNYVVMNFTANALLALGASPVMAHAVEEVEEMATHAHALVLNLGTLSGPWLQAMLRAAHVANRRQIPIVLDPVGAGATRYRSEAALTLLNETRVAVLRGNASEIEALCRSQVSSDQDIPATPSAGQRGVDSTAEVEGSLAAAKELSRRHGCTVVVSGPVDLIVHGSREARVANGHPLMPKVTGMGCAATALVGAFLAVETSPFEAATCAMAVNGVAGELAGQRAEGPGSFQQHFLDALYRLNEHDFSTRLRLERP
jgi:hydroxyethylthiazole kinase